MTEVEGGTDSIVDCRGMIPLLVADGGAAIQRKDAILELGDFRSLHHSPQIDDFKDSNSGYNHLILIIRSTISDD